MKNSDNIEKLFKETFDRFEADVNPQVWTNVQSGIQSVSGGSASVAAKFTIGKIFVGAASMAIIAGGILYFNPSSEKKQVSESVAQEVSNQNVTTKTQLPESASDPAPSSNWQAPPAVRTLNQTIADNNKEEPVSSRSNEQIVSSEASALENNTTFSSPQTGKYGNAPKGDGGMIRGTQNASASAHMNAAVSSSSEVPQEDASLPAVAIFVNTTSGEAPLTVNFINQGIASSLSWDFGDGSGSRDNSPTHTFTEPGNYAVKVTAKNSSGISSDKVVIEVKASSSITNIPNIFTPNGDGENDYFFFEMKNIVSVGIAIYSQKGGQIFTSNSVDEKWNGKLLNGQDAPEGVYLYSIQANGADGIVHSKRGFVTLSIKR